MPTKATNVASLHKQIFEKHVLHNTGILLRLKVLLKLLDLSYLCILSTGLICFCKLIGFHVFSLYVCEMKNTNKRNIFDD